MGSSCCRAREKYPVYNYLVAESGVENLSGFIPREPDDIEKLMAERGLFRAAKSE